MFRRRKRSASVCIIQSVNEFLPKLKFDMNPKRRKERKITLNNGECDHLRCGRYLKNRGLVRGQPRPRPPRVRLRLTGDAPRLRPAPHQDGREIFGGGADLSTYFPQCKVAPEKLNFPMSYLGRQTLCWFVAAA